MIHNVRRTAQKIAQRIVLIEPLVYRRRRGLAPFRFAELPGPLTDPPVSSNVNDADWDVIKPHTYWGRWMMDFVLRGSFQVPDNWDPAMPVALHLPLGEAGDFSHPEALVYIDGAPYAACDRHHQEILLPDRWRDGQPHLLALHGWTGLGGFANNELNTRLFMRQCAIVQIDQPTRDFISTTRVALGIANSLEDDDPAKGRLLNALDKAIKMLDTREPFGGAFYESVAPAHEALREGITRAGPPLDVDIIATGHAHIDVAWLWTLGQTRQKSARTFYHVLRLMEQFPDYHFTQSQPQLYDFVRQDFPALFEGIQERVAEGRWEPIGGMWVEADCNISGPEALARQFLLGRAFFRKHFGPDAESPVLWLPDVFGYAWNLPQLIKQAGLDYFMTTKLSWNQYNSLPYDSFWWQGLDGTRVLTHFITTPGDEQYGGSTYNGMATPEETVGTWRNFKQKEFQRTLLMAYGFGDGGGGPTREMLENIHEMAAFPSTPRVRQGSVLEFFRAMEAEAGDHLPTWNGELYLELHRGTYTTHARSKLANRKSEFLLHDAEFVAALAALLEPTYTYPADTFRKAWELVCLNQFHDIIPGSSIILVYEESLRQYAEISEMAGAARDEALGVVANRVGGDLLVANPVSFARADLAFRPCRLEPDQRLLQADETPVLTQATEDGTWIAPGELAPYSVTPLVLADGAPPSPETGLIITPTLLENDSLRVELSEEGDIIRIYDKTNAREVLPEGEIANRLQAFEDRPVQWDAWDIDIFYDDKMWLADPATSVKVVESGPLRVALEVRRRILRSEVVQRISLVYNSPRLDFDTTINWQERHILLKVAFPVNVLSPVATYEIQWGSVQRPTHRNTSWDWARFEVCAQKWVDLSEGDYGVSLLNDCKYGHDVRDNVMRISLLRGTTMPDPIADLGEHRFTYSLLPHQGRWDIATIPAAYAVNDPLIIYQPESAAPVREIPASLIAVDRPHIIIETIKQAEDGSGVIVRLYEAHRSRGWVTLQTGFEITAAWWTNLLEENQEELAVEDGMVRLYVRPYEICTLRLIPAG